MAAGRLVRSTAFSVGISILHRLSSIRNEETSQGFPDVAGSFGMSYDIAYRTNCALDFAVRGGEYGRLLAIYTALIFILGTSRKIDCHLYDFSRRR